MKLIRPALPLAAFALLATAPTALAQNSSMAPSPGKSPVMVPPPTVHQSSSTVGFVGDTTIAGGWDAFETASGQSMEVLDSGVGDFTLVNTIGSGCGNVDFVPGLEKRTVGASWGTWSHGYFGEMFWTQGSLTATINLPAGTTAFDFYSEPNPFSLQDFTATCTDDGGATTTVMFSADGTSGASHCGFYTSSRTLVSIDISCTADFAIGELRIGCGPGGFGDLFCSPAAPNSTGVPGEISGSGSMTASDNNLTITGSNMPAGQFSYLLNSMSTITPLPVGSGFLCLGSPQGRHTAQIGQVSAAGTFDTVVDLVNLPQASGTVTVVAGETWYFQLWHRDVGGTSNFTDALCLTFN